MSIIVPVHVQKACKILNDNNFQAYIIGGAVRDSLLFLSPTDWDITTDAQPAKMEELFEKTIPTGKKFGTVTVLIDNQPLEITTMRHDGPYIDGRHPEHIAFTNQLEGDLARRDFTINAIAYEPFEKRIIDPFGGVKHLKKKILITVGDPNKRFQEDPLRMLRLVRFQSTLGFKIEKKTRLALQAQWIRKVSSERIQTELNKMLLGRELGPALKLFYHSGLMQEVIPELAAGAGVSPGRTHPYDLLGHSIMAAHFAHPTLPLRWAALLHDIGKTETLKREHEKISADLAEKILIRLRCNKTLISEVKTLIANHMFEIHPHSSDGAIRRFLARVGINNAFALVKLRQADLAGLNEDPRQIIKFGELMEARFNEILLQDNALTLQDLAINGHNLMYRFKINPGPLVGQILHYLLEAVWVDPTLNQPERLMSLAQNYLKSRPQNNQ